MLADWRGVLQVVLLSLLLSFLLSFLLFLSEGWLRARDFGAVVVCGGAVIYRVLRHLGSGRQRCCCGEEDGKAAVV